MPTPQTSAAATKFPAARNIRHDLDSTQVQAQLAIQIAKEEATRLRRKAEAQQLLVDYTKAQADGTAHRWAKVPQGDGNVDATIDNGIALEREHYALVRVIELPQEGKRFVLVYGDAVDAEVISGTGPFESYDVAAGWFLRGGR